VGCRACWRALVATRRHDDDDSAALAAVHAVARADEHATLGHFAANGFAIAPMTWCQTIKLERHQLQADLVAQAAWPFVGFGGMKICAPV